MIKIKLKGMRESIITGKETGMGVASCKPAGRHIFFVLAVFCCLLVFSAAAGAAELSKDEARATLYESIRALLTGAEFSPELQQKQAVLKEMLDAGTLKKSDLKGDAMQKMILALLDECQTSRYILKEVPARVEKLLALPLFRMGKKWSSPSPPWRRRERPG